MRVLLEKAEAGWYESASGELVDDLLELLDALPAGTKIAVSVADDFDEDSDEDDEEDLFDEDSDADFA